MAEAVRGWVIDDYKGASASPEGDDSWYRFELRAKLVRLAGLLYWWSEARKDSADMIASDEAERPES